MENSPRISRASPEAEDLTDEDVNVYTGDDEEIVVRERSASDMTKLLNVPRLGESLKYPSAPDVASDTYDDQRRSVLAMMDGSESSNVVPARNLDYRLKERHVYRESMDKETRLGVYCSPRFYRKKNFAASSSNSYGENSLREDFGMDNSMDNSPTDSNGSSARSELSRKSYQENIRKKRPLSLVGLDTRRRFREGQNGKHTDGITNLGSSCCNLRTSLVERDYRLRSPTSRGDHQSTLSPFTERSPSFQLSRSCSDLRDGMAVNVSPMHPTIQELRCPSHVSLQSIRVSSPSESRISLLSDLEIYERAHHRPRHADSPPLYPDVGCPALSSTALVQEWLARQEKYSLSKHNPDSGGKPRTGSLPR